MICGVLSDPELFKLYFVLRGSVVNIALSQNCKWILLHMNANCFLSSFFIEIQKNAF